MFYNGSRNIKNTLIKEKQFRELLVGYRDMSFVDLTPLLQGRAARTYTEKSCIIAVATRIVR